MSLPNMIYKRNGQEYYPLKTFRINGQYILAIYQCSLSIYDLLIKYGPKETNNWSGIRTPKHIHWVVDILLLSDELLDVVKREVEQYPKLVEKGEYSVRFLLLVAKLLMFQEKTNLDTTYMFKKVLKALKDKQDIFKIVSIATHNRI